MVQVVRLVDQQHDRLLAFADQVDQLSLTQLGPAIEAGQTSFRRRAVNDPFSYKGL